MTGTPLHAAAAGSRTRSWPMLLEAGADPNKRQRHGFTPLHAAAANGDLGSVERSSMPAPTPAPQRRRRDAARARGGFRRSGRERALRVAASGRGVGEPERLHGRVARVPRAVPDRARGHVCHAPERGHGRAALGLMPAERIGRMLVVLQEPMERVHRDGAGGRGREQLRRSPVPDPRVLRVLGVALVARHRRAHVVVGVDEVPVRVGADHLGRGRRPLHVRHAAAASTRTLLYDDALAGSRRRRPCPGASAHEASRGPGSHAGCRPVRRSD